MIPCALFSAEDVPYHAMPKYYTFDEGAYGLKMT